MGGTYGCRRNQGTEREKVIEQLTVDSSVIVASLLEKEKEHSKAFKVWAEVLTGKTMAIMPYIVLVEVVAAVRRRTADKELALKIKKELLSAGSVNFTIVDPEAALEASDIAIETGMRGMDAIVVQTAKEYGTSLVTLDNEMINKATGIVKIKEL
jgi:predicted nucleic acid-binding protein